MGAEVKGTLGVGSDSFAGTALLEGDVLPFRGVAAVADTVIFAAAR